MALSRRTGRSRYTLILLVLTSLTVITLDFRGESSGVIDTVRETALDAFTPVKNAADTVFSPVSNAWNGIFNYDDLKDENAKLKDQLAQVQGDKAAAQAANERYGELLGQLHLPWVHNIKTVTARVVTSPVSNFELSFQIDKGRDAGIKQGMTVVAAKGLVGRVVRVSTHQSVVQLVTDRDFAVGVRLTRTNEIAVATGRGRDEPMQLTFISRTVKLHDGDTATTSGLPDSAFPPDIPIGRVLTHKAAEGGLGQEGTLVPAIDPDRLTFVTVLLWLERK